MAAFRTLVSVDFNGIVMFDPDRLRAFYGGSIAEGTNLFRRYTITDEGDRVLAEGLIVPVLAITDAGYPVTVRLSSDPSEACSEIIVENGVYPLRVDKRLVVADLSVIREWIDDADWIDVPAEPGCYGVTIVGSRRVEGGRIEDHRYEFVLDPRAQLPLSTADLGKNMQLLY